MLLILQDYHVHTTFCDGKNRPEEMVQAALCRGMTTLGFSGHSTTTFDASYCMSLNGMAAYRQEIARLKEEYAGKIQILCGIEQDRYTDVPLEGFDYRIGSVHYLKIDGKIHSMDAGLDSFKALLAAFGNDPYALAECYYETVAGIDYAQILGHFDYITIFNKALPVIDEQHPRYIAAWKNAADAQLARGTVFEINTGGVARGYKDTAYPSPDILRYIQSRGGKVVLTSDAHKAENLMFGFETYEKLAEEMGLRLVKEGFLCG